MFSAAFFKALCGWAEWAQDEVRHPRVARVSRRTFARVVGAFVLIEAIWPSGVAGSSAPLGACSGCRQHRCPDGCSAAAGECTQCGPYPPCYGTNCWCAGNPENWDTVCDCRCGGELCQCRSRDDSGPCRSFGKGPGDLM